jgi:putative spermidine/putrescine transport system ATP-binding protein/spermidine/putrescine transport system ATP-binding protein
MRLEVPEAPLAQAAIGDVVDVFIRPEHLALTSGSTPGSLRGTVTAQVFQGDHIDLYIDVAGIAREPVLLRAPGIAALSSCPVGTEVGLVVRSNDVVAFLPEASSRSATSFASR